MKLDEAIRQAANEPDNLHRTKLVEGVVAFMRFQLGWRYKKELIAVEKCGVSADRWEELLMEVDNQFR